MNDPSAPSAKLTRESGFRFRARFGGAREVTWITDEPAPIGEGAGPNPAALLAAAVGNCLASSLLFCMQKSRLDVEGMEVEVRAELTRNEQGRLRIGAIHVSLAPTVTDEVRHKMARCLELYESFCIVTESVRDGIDVEVAVSPRLSDAPAGSEAGLVTKGAEES